MHETADVAGERNWCKRREGETERGRAKEDGIEEERQRGEEGEREMG